MYFLCVWFKFPVALVLYLPLCSFLLGQAFHVKLVQLFEWQLVSYSLFTKVKNNCILHYVLF